MPNTVDEVIRSDQINHRRNEGRHPKPKCSKPDIQIAGQKRRKNKRDRGNEI